MKQKNGQLQELKHNQKLSAQQVLENKLLELNVEGLLQRIEDELLENEALEKGSEEDTDSTEENGAADSEDFGTQEGVLDDHEDGDEGEHYASASGSDVASWQTRNEQTFRDLLEEQLREMDLTEKQDFIIDYLIQSLEDSGLLSKDLQQIADEMQVRENVLVTLEELEECLKQLQQFEPAGVGARTLQECMMLQVERRHDGRIKELLLHVLQEHFSDLGNQRWDKIAESLELDEEEVKQVRKEITRLDPKPGGSMHTDGSRPNSIVPDFLLTVEDDEILVRLNNSYLPSLHISNSFRDAIEAADKQKLSKKAAQEMAYAREKIKKAQGFIDAIVQRRAMLLRTMRIIAKLQMEYFQTGDESALLPLTMKEVAGKVKVDISTISRVCNSKYVQTPYGTHLLKDYFVGESEPAKKELSDIVGAENKNEPYNDTQLQQLLKKAGYDISRRTVAKYRLQLNIPNAQARKV